MSIIFSVRALCDCCWCSSAVVSCFFFCHLFLSCVTVRKCFVWIWHFVIETRNENTSVVYAIISFFIFHFKKKKKLLFRSFVISTEKKQLIFLLLFWVLTHCYCFCLLYSYFCVVFSLFACCACTKLNLKWIKNHNSETKSVEYTKKEWGKKLE